MANDTLYWDRPFSTVRSGSFEEGDIQWFPEGGLNAAYNCVDRYASIFSTISSTSLSKETDWDLVLSVVRWAYTQPDKVGSHFPFALHLLLHSAAA